MLVGRSKDFRESIAVERQSASWVKYGLLLARREKRAAFISLRSV